MRVDLSSLSLPDRYPRSTVYDPGWLVGLEMGPHPLWQLEDLLADLPLRPGDHVLDLGAGRGATSVFLVREYGVTVDALDAWVPPEQATATFAAAGVADRVCARQGDVRTTVLPEHAYDAIISVDAWEYFGTDAHFLRHLLAALRPGGRLGFTTPALREDPYLVDVDPLLDRAVGWEVAAWRPAGWWRRHTELTGDLVEVTARVPTDSLELWLRWNAAVEDGPSDLTKALRGMVARDTAARVAVPELGFVLVSGKKPS